MPGEAGNKKPSTWLGFSWGYFNLPGSWCAPLARVYQAQNGIQRADFAMTWAILQATEDHARWIAPRMTAEDRAEVEAAGFSPLTAILTSLRLSLFSQTWLVDGEPACMFGFATPSMLGPLAQPWMLGTMLVRRHKIAFLRNYRAQIGRMLDAFPVLETVVDARHAVCLKWLSYTGFTLLEQSNYGPSNLPFVRVRLERSTWAQ